MVDSTEIWTDRLPDTALFYALSIMTFHVQFGTFYMAKCFTTHTLLECMVEIKKISFFYSLSFQIKLLKAFHIGAQLWMLSWIIFLNTIIYKNDSCEKIFDLWKISNYFFYLWHCIDSTVFDRIRKITTFKKKPLALFLQRFFMWNFPFSSERNRKFKNRYGKG